VDVFDSRLRRREHCQPVTETGKRLASPRMKPQQAEETPIHAAGRVMAALLLCEPRLMSPVNSEHQTLPGVSFLNFGPSRLPVASVFRAKLNLAVLGLLRCNPMSHCVRHEVIAV
jgi:hypothetical protein